MELQALLCRVSGFTILDLAPIKSDYVFIHAFLGKRDFSGIPKRLDSRVGEHVNFQIGLVLKSPAAFGARDPRGSVLILTHAAVTSAAGRSVRAISGLVQAAVATSG